MFILCGVEAVAIIALVRMLDGANKRYRELADAVDEMWDEEPEATP